MEHAHFQSSTPQPVCLVRHHKNTKVQLKYTSRLPRLLSLFFSFDDLSDIRPILPILTPHVRKILRRLFLRMPEKQDQEIFPGGAGTRPARKVLMNSLSGVLCEVDFT